jgi:putative transposase
MQFDFGRRILWYCSLYISEEEHESITNARKDYLDKISTYPVKSHDVIGLEDLSVSGMLKNSHLSKAVSEVA